MKEKELASRPPRLGGERKVEKSFVTIRFWSVICMRVSVCACGGAVEPEAWGKCLQGTQASPGILREISWKRGLCSAAWHGCFACAPRLVSPVCLPEEDGPAELLDSSWLVSDNTDSASPGVPAANRELYKVILDFRNAVVLFFGPRWCQIH